MRTSSCKAKGRRLQGLVAQKISDVLKIPWGKDELIRSREMGQSGTDISVIGLAKELFPFSSECKNQETWSVLQWIKQAKSNTKEGSNWLLFCKKNHIDPVVIMDMEHFFSLYKRLLIAEGKITDEDVPKVGV